MTKLEIEPKLVKIIDDRLAKNNYAQLMIKEKNPRMLMCEAAKVLVGTKEKTGNNDGELIELFQETVGGHNHEAYCVAGLMTLAAYAMAKIPTAKFLLPVTESSQTLWFDAPDAQRVKFMPLPGAFAVWGDLKKGKPVWTGHGELFLHGDEKTFYDIGFNTSGTTNPNSTVNPNGNGVYYTVRTRKNTASRQFLGFLKPF